MLHVGKVAIVWFLSPVPVQSLGHNRRSFLAFLDALSLKLA